MTPETRTAFTTAVFVTVPVVIALAAFTYLGPGHGHTPKAGPSNCSDLTGGTYWALELNNDNGTPGNPAYVLATIDLSSRGGLKHNVEVNWKTLQAGGATESTSEYDFNPTNDCNINTNRLTFHPDDTTNDPSLTVTLAGNGVINAVGGNPSVTWSGWISLIH